MQRDPVSGQPIGTLVGVAVEDIVTGQRIKPAEWPALRSNERFLALQLP